MKKTIVDSKKILITGGTGSFGQAFVSYLLKNHAPHSIRIYSRDELKQYDMRRRFNNDSRLRFLIGDVRDATRLERACEDINIVIHAAALKQVPSCEYNPLEAIKTNINGAVNVIEACLDKNVERIVALSTDKAVNPINLYGATKLCSDKLFIQANAYVGSRKTRFSVVRYGNVLASRGSIIPLFQHQIQEGKKLTITDTRMTRFWITLSGAVKFVLSSLSMMKGGEIFVPKLPSMKITDLANALLPKFKMDIIGIRDGEKLDEYLISVEEGKRTVELKDRYIIEPGSNIFATSITNGKKVREEFSYNSKDNKQWLSQKAMKIILKQQQDY